MRRGGIAMAIASLVAVVLFLVFGRGRAVSDRSTVKLASVATVSAPPVQDGEVPPSVRGISLAQRAAHARKLRAIDDAFAARRMHLDIGDDETETEAEGLHPVKPPKLSDPKYIESVLQEQIAPLLTECYDLAVTAGQQKPHGTLRVAFRVVGDPDLGAVIALSEVLEKGTTLELLSTPLADCARETMYALDELPAPPDFGYVDIAYPFEFVPPSEDGIVIERVEE